MATKRELEAKVEVLNEERKEEVIQSTALEGKLAALKREQEGLQVQFLEACKRQAKNLPNDHESIQKAIALNEMSITGFEQLVAEKQARVSAIRAEMEPLSRKLGELCHQENVEKERAEIDDVAEKGKQALVNCVRAENLFAQLMTRLRSYASPENQSRAFGHAEALLNAKTGRRVEAVFSPEELAELSKAL